MEKIIIVRYCEIHLKGKNRKHFEKLLINNIENQLKDIPHNLSQLNARYIISGFKPDDYSAIVYKLDKTAGVHSYSPAYMVKSNLEEIRECALKLIEGKSGEFKVNTNRADKTFKYHSVELSSMLGGDMLEANKNLKVNVVKPEFSVNIDLRESGDALIYADTIKASGGLPVGSSGKGIVMLSGGIDSPVASFMLAKRGMKLDAVHFHSYPFTSEAAKEKVISLAKVVGEYNNGMRLYVVKFTEIQEAIHEKCPEELMITIMRRFMMRIAERIARQNSCQAIVTGESLGQVASQTIEGITSSDAVVNIPVLRPLIGMDKLEIIEIAQKIGTYETSILPFEDCCTVFLPKFPAIKPRLEKIIKYEKNLEIDRLVEAAISQMEVINL